MPTDRDTGLLYVLASRDSSLAKVGMTRNGTPQMRADDYSRQHGIEWTRVYWSALTEDAETVEARLHAELRPYRFSLVPGAIEIYHLVPAKAVSVAQRHIIAPAGAIASATPARSLALTHHPIWPVCRKAIMAAAAFALARAFGDASRAIVHSVDLRMLSGWLRGL